MQRTSRINRIRTKFDEINVYNFKPSIESDKLIELSKKAFVKLQTFHDTLGEDSAVYTEEEIVGSQELFDTSNTTETDKELRFLEEIREFKENNSKKYLYIKNFSNKIRVQRKNKDYKNISYVFIKNNKHKSYYFVRDNISQDITNLNIMATNFIQMASCIKANESEKSIPPITNLHYNQISEAKSYHENQEKD